MDVAEAEPVLVAWLKAEFPDARVLTETPADLQANLPCIRVTRFGGLDDEVPVYDTPSLDFDCYHLTRGQARTLAHQVRTSIRERLPGQTVGGAFVERTRTLAGPVWTPYDDTNLRRFTYSAQIRLRTH